MGLLGSFVRLIFTRLIPFVVISLALLIGWLRLAPVPEGKFFATIIPAVNGVWPPTIVGHGKMTGTPEVPDDMLPEPRPEHELSLDLPGGFKIPQSGLGMCCRPTAYDDVMVERTILHYLLMGGRHIDTAHLYLNHHAIGRGIQQAIRRGVPREEIFVTTKVFPSYYGRNTTLSIVPTFLEELGLEYIDLVLMHMPGRVPGLSWMSSECSTKGYAKQECRKETYQALSELRDQGLMRNIGVSNFPTKLLKEIQAIENVAPIANNQINFNPWVSDGWMDTVEYCKEHDITVTGYFTLGGNFQHHETHTIAVLTGLAAKHGKSVAQIMLRWALQMGTIVIPGTGNPKHMRENLAIYEFELSEQDMESIASLRTSEEVAKFMKMEDTLYD
jgi:aldehyde reductase